MFHDGPKHQFWWAPWTSPGFRHVSLLTFTHGAWILLDPRLSQMELRIFSSDEMNTYVACINVAGGSFLRMPVSVVRCHQPLSPMYCVTVAKRLLGIQSLAITPKQLYHGLIKRGALKIFKYQPEEE